LEPQTVWAGGAIFHTHSPRKAFQCFQEFLEVNVAIMRTFVKLREMITENRELVKRLNNLELKYDRDFKSVFAAIRELMSNHSVPRKRIIGLSKEECPNKKPDQK
jgi:DnaJ-domain-containing protein 1